MSVFTVHEPPWRTAYAPPEPERFIFVRDGFYWWGFLLTPFWLLRHRLWLVLVLYVLVSVALGVALHRFGGSAFALAVANALISLLVGFEGATLWRFTLGRRGWRNLGVVSGDDLEDAERRFFDAWVRGQAKRPAAAVPTAGPMAVSPSPPPGSSGVIGLFPEPGAPR